MSKISSAPIEKKAAPEFTPICELTPDYKGYCIRGMIFKNSLELLLEGYNFDGNLVKLYGALMGDETGSVKLRLTNQQAEQIRNAPESWWELINGKKQIKDDRLNLRYDNWGTLRVANEVSGQAKTEPCVSNVVQKRERKQNNRKTNN